LIFRLRRTAARHILASAAAGEFVERALGHQQIETATGLTLSDAQLQYIPSVARGARLRKESWIDHTPTQNMARSFDPGRSILPAQVISAGKDWLYRSFAKCRSWPRLRGDVIADDRLWHHAPDENNAFISTHIFPD
jgi:cyclopropane fatty-acyl-phospholipid synthase-like methyltransferase